MGLLAVLSLAMVAVQGYAPGVARSLAPTTLPRRSIGVPTAGFIDDIIVKIADGFSEQKKGFGVLDYNADKRTAKASHILFSFEAYPDGEGAQMASALKKKILDGEYTFEFVAEKFSADQTSATNGGSLGTVKRGQMVPEFDEAVFKVDDAVPIGTLQGPIKTIFGHHLVKVTERDPVA